MHPVALVLHHIHNPRSQQSVYAQPPGLDQIISRTRNLISHRKSGSEGVKSRIWKDRRTAAIEVCDNDTANGKVQSGRVTESLWVLIEQLRS
jgi:hypothetical protein